MYVVIIFTNNSLKKSEDIIKKQEKQIKSLNVKIDILKMSNKQRAKDIENIKIFNGRHLKDINKIKERLFIK